jgi:hypothetical protein
VVIVKQPAITAKTTTTTTPTITTPKTPKTTKKSTKREQTTGSKETGTGTAGERPKGGQTPAAPLALATARQSQELSEDPFAYTVGGARRSSPNRGIRTDASGVYVSCACCVLCVDR